jgi:hypothetical protein
MARVARRENTSDLTAKEQTHVRAAIRVLRVRCGGWAALGRILRVNESTLRLVMKGATVSVTMAFRVARFSEVSIDDLLAGQFLPPGACPNCGHVQTPE